MNRSLLKTTALSMVALAFATEAAMATEWNVSLWGKRRAFTEHVEKIAELVKAKTNGAFTLNLSYGGLSKNKENLDGISIGAFEMAQFCAGYHADKNPSITVLELPFLGVDSLDKEVAVSMALYKHPAVVKDLARWNATLLMPSPMPQYNIVGMGDAPKTLADFKGLSVRATGGIGNTYQELEARKMALRAALAQGRDPVDSLDDAMDATINGIATLYMWEVHGGARPSEVGRVRSWDVRDWMKGHNFTQQSLPGMYLRDEVVERLRAYGLHLTPKPLTHTAHEYYSMQYDRKADIHAPFGRRKTPEQLEEAARKAEEKAAKKAAKQAEKEARKAAKAAEKAEKEAAKQAEDEAKATASLAAVDTVIDEGPAYADEPAEETYEEGQVFHSSHDDPSDMTDEDEEDYGMIEDAETNTRPN